MPEQDKPSAGALRTASRFIRHSEHIKRWVTTPQDAEQALAELIDRETGVAELLEAAKLALLTQYYEATTHIDAMRKLEQAVAKAERGA